MLTGKSIVCFANDWENDPTSKHHVMKILSQQNKILWINSIGMRKPTLSSSDFSRIIGKLKAWTKGAVQVNDSLFHYTPVVLPFPSSRLAGKINKVLLKMAISYYRKKLGMGDIQLWTFLPNISEIIGTFGENLLVYYCVDEWSKFSFMDGESLRRQELVLLEKADLVLVSADFLYKDKVQFNSNTHLVTHGVDYDFFSKSLEVSQGKAGELAGVEGPILGFFGLIHEWIDLELLAYIARERPDWTIVLIGKQSVSMDSLAEYENVILAGQKPYNILPEFCKCFDVGLIPFKINELTMNVNPIKMREYLAAGLPVVATALPEIEKYRELVSIGYSPQEFLALIERELIEDSTDRKQYRSLKMKEETWENKVEAISELVENLLSR